MSILGSILTSIFGGPAEAAPLTPGEQPAKAAAPGAPSPNSPASKGSVDVAAILDKLKAGSKEKNIDWRKSIVDLMKLLNLDSGLAARKKLAKELNYDGDTKNSAEMNVWLHKQVMAKLVENGGTVPPELRD